MTERVAVRCVAGLGVALVIVTGRALVVGAEAVGKWDRMAECNEVRAGWNAATVRDMPSRRWWADAMAEACRNVPESARIAIVD